jgi:hypothetical protein
MTTTNVLELIAKSGVPHQLNEILSHYKEWDKINSMALADAVGHHFWDESCPVTDFQIYLSEVIDNDGLAILYALLENTDIAIRPVSYEFYKIPRKVVSP